MYPSSDILLTLSKDRLRPGNTSASLAALVSVSKGSFVRRDVRDLALFGRNTSLLDAPAVGKLRSSVKKCNIAPESMIILFSCRLAIRLIHLFDLFTFVIVVELILLI